MHPFKEPTLFHHHSCPCLRRIAFPRECGFSPSWVTHSGALGPCVQSGALRRSEDRHSIPLVLTRLRVCVLEPPKFEQRCKSRCPTSLAVALAGSAPRSTSKPLRVVIFSLVEHCDPRTVQRTLVEQHFGVFVCVSFRV